MTASFGGLEGELDFRGEDGRFKGEDGGFRSSETFILKGDSETFNLKGDSCFFEDGEFGLKICLLRFGEESSFFILRLCSMILDAASFLLCSRARL